MGMKPRLRAGDRRVLTIAKPVRAPAWWPREVDGRPAWVVLTATGGWSTIATARDLRPRAHAGRDARQWLADQDRKFVIEHVTLREALTRYNVIYHAGV